MRAATRGDGTTGEDVTANMRTVKTPLRLRQGALVRRRRGRAGGAARRGVHAEVQLRRAERRSRRERQQAFANPRNAAAGSLRQKPVYHGEPRPVHLHLRGGRRARPERRGASGSFWRGCARLAST
ncbi:MAG: hypothetical protein ACLR3C_14740 [Eggerthella lenta]